MTRNMNVYGKFTDMFKYLIKGTYVHELTNICSSTHEHIFVGPRTYVLQKLLFLMVLMTLGNASVWGQVGIDYSGTYYIKNVSVNHETADDYYLCPTEGWIYYEATNTFTDDPTNGQPFLTTYPCKSAAGYDTSKALWKIEKSGNYYTIKNVCHNKYIVYNGQISDANANRIRVHLENVVTPTQDGNELFVIGTNTAGNIVISPKNNSKNYFNVCQGNINSLAGSETWIAKEKSDGPTTPTNHKKDIHGTIGLYTDINDVNAPFLLEEYIARPEISYTSANNVTITYPTSQTIYYTTDGSDPTDENANRQSFTGTSQTVSFTNVAVVKAAAYINGEYSNIATYVYVHTGSGNPYLLQSVANTDFYMLAGDNNSSSKPTVNTSSLPQAGMSWHFEDAGIVNGVQCYYVYNTSAAGYLRRDNNNFYIQSTNANNNDYKFYVIPYLNDSGTLAGFYLYNIGKAQYVYKSNNNNVVGNGSNGAVNLTATSNQDLARWNLILVANKSFSSPVTLSDNSSTTYYTFASSNTPAQLITPPTGTLTYVKTSSGVNDNQKWFFQDAGTDGWASYYYIINGQTGEAMYFGKGAASTTISDALEMRPLPETPTDNYKFALAHTVTDGEYYIVPKLLAQYTKTNYTAVWYVNTTSSLQTQSNRASSQIKWQVSEMVDYVAQPYITYDVATNTATISSTYSGATIYYTTDGTEATTSSPNAVAPVAPSYTASTSFVLTADVTTIRAIVSKGASETSSEATYSVVVQPTLSDDPADLRPYLIQSQNNAWNSTDFHFYMIPGDDDNSVKKVNTTSLFRPSMEWYFKDAGVESGKQYYYIVNKANSKNLCYNTSNTANGIYMDTNSDNSNKFKFQIKESSTAGTFNIIPYGLTSGNMYVNKYSANSDNKALGLHSSATDANSRWKFVLPSTLDKTAPFKVSDGSSRTHYKLRSSGDEYYVKAPAAANANATMVAAASADENTYWYLEQAAAATSEDWLTYYYIRNAQTGDYLYYTTNGNQSDNNAAFKTSATLGEGDELQRYQFAWARSTTADYYFIVPKILRDQTLNYFSTMNRNGTTLRVQKVRATGTSAWTFVETPFCNDPVITQALDRTVTITCATPGVDIYYTTDGSEPTVPVGETTTQLYTIPFVPGGEANQIRAIAVSRNDDASRSTIVPFTLPKYTYHIVNLSNGIAISSEAIQQTAGTPLRNGNTDENKDGITDGFNDIPVSLRSPYISDETIKFYSWDGAFDASKLKDENKIETTPTGSANIYITYTVEKLGNKSLHLQGARPFNLKNSTSQYFVNSSGTSLTFDETNTDTEPRVQNANKDHLWYISGGDPYAVQITCPQTGNYLTSSTSSVSAVLNTFILTAEESSTVTFKDASGSVSVTVNSVVLPRSYTLIDRKGAKIQDLIAYSDEEGFKLPSSWRSPLATYHYWNAAAFVDTNGDGVPVIPYVLKTPTPDEITDVTQVSDDNVIYVTYDVDNTQLDLDGRNLLGVEKKVGTTYMLRFANGVNFNQEDGLDGVMSETRKPVYPYSNGDASLYVYGSERWEEQLASGASTRTRWLWYIEPANNPTTQAELDPYHVKISSYQTQTSYKYTENDEEKTRNFHSYLKTYKPEGYSSVVTGVTNDNPKVKGKAEDADADNSDATEYMILGTALSSLKLVTTHPVDGAPTNELETYGTRQTVNSFEQYWKNSPTVQGKLTTSNKVVTPGRNVKLGDAQKTEITGFGWHIYETWANSAPWVHNNDGGAGKTPTTSKKFLKEEHIFQTVSMGNGSFQFVEMEIKPMLILLDQHGWEIVRLPLPNGPTDPNRPEIYAAIHKYNSPMVSRYHYWKTVTKEDGYHKYKIAPTSYATKSDVDLTEYTTEELGVYNAETQVGNLPNYETQAFVDGKERDWYVTYDVKPEYANTYAAAATEIATSAAQFLLKQGGHYAKRTDDDKLVSTTSDEDNNLTLENAPTNLLWRVKPNFNIDKEMGYLYVGETGAQEGAKTKLETETDYLNGVTPGWTNGFDPYNVQIQSVANENRYFTANTSTSKVTSSWSGTSSSMDLDNLGVKDSQRGVIGLDQTKMNITNATFMVVDDGNGNMRLMPRFDNTKVMQSFTTLAAQADPASVDDKGMGIQTIYLTLVPQVVYSSDEIKAMGAHYLLASTFTASGSIGTKTAPFKGIIEGQIDHSFSVTAPFIAYAEDATIKNVIIENANISSGNEDGNVGAICCEASGATRIYNCGVNAGSVSGTNYVGGIVGLLKEDKDPEKKEGARVINCYSYADITGGTYVGGIVGYNNYLSTAANLRTMVMNCMFYGNITGNGNKAPIYNGSIISNVGGTGLGNYNYFLAEQPYVENNQINTYNCALMAEKRFLQRFEFFRLLLNSHLDLAAWYATGNYDANEMMKWVLETADRAIEHPKSYPLLKARGKYPSIINYDAENAPDNTSVGRNHGGKLGKTLTVHIDGVGSNAPSGASILKRGAIKLNRTDKDFDRFNFNYDKVQLPYYNDVGTGNYTKNRVVTGWKITSITGGSAGSYTTGADATTDADGNITSAPYNFADRNCTNKDLFSVSGRVFNQGAYWDVPSGVTAITIEPYWAKAVYLADSNADVVYNESMETPYDVPNVGGGQLYTNGSTYNIAGDEQVVYTTMENAKNALGLASGQTVYDNAIVLVGNAHNIGVPSKSANDSYTIMSADFDHDNEPDYSYILRYNGRTETHPVRVDFLNIPGLGMAQKSTNGTGSYNFGIMQPVGWFESTNTSLFRVTQFEFDRSNRGAAPLIVQGGVMEQWVSGQSNGIANQTTYFHVGGNAWFKEFHRGTHQDQTYSSKHPPVSVTGGDFDEFYLTGLYRGDIASYEDNAECYISGGRFGILAGAGQEGIGKAGGADNTGNITWQIQYADIEEFYGGGFNAAKPVEGNIATTIVGSHVTTFCGGPKFGDMNTGKTVHTKATGCTFGTYFGAGYGGSSYSRYAPTNKNAIINIGWNAWVKEQYKQDYSSTYGGVSTQFNYQFIPQSGNTNNVARIFVEYVKFSLATTRNVTSQLTGCTVTGNFYGGGSLGKVDGDVTSTLTGCTVKGNIFGAGFSASLPTVEVDSIGFRTEPKYYEQAGTFAAGVKGVTTTYRWEHGNSISIDKNNHILYTTEPLTSLGAVTGTVTLTIDGATVVGDDQNVNSGNVYGGGESSDATGDVNVNILNGSMTDVYGGGKGETTVVGGNVTVNIGAKTGEAPSITYTGSGLVQGDVYGGSALGDVNATKEDGYDYTVDSNAHISATTGKAATVNIYAGAVNGSVFGGGRGDLTSLGDGHSNIDARNFGPVSINMEGGTVSTAVYGGANVNGVIKSDATVTITGGTVGTAPDPESSDPIANAVFGGGYGEPTLVNGNVMVNIGTSGQTEGGATINGHVYGGGALGSVNAYMGKDAEDNPELKFNESNTTRVNLYKGTIHGDAYGGGLGQKNGLNGATSNVEAFVGGDVLVTLDGAKVQQVFGCNNLNGTPKGAVEVHVYRTVGDSAKDSGKTREERSANPYTYDVAAVYGGGNQADYIPTNNAAHTKVIIEGCELTSIDHVYGGGNAAAVPATEVIIKGSYIINTVYGGGNGAGDENLGANVGYKSFSSLNPTEAEKTSKEYGTGKAVTQLLGGYINSVYGGSNTRGDVRGGTDVRTKGKFDTAPADCCPALNVGDIYGAGSHADVNGDVKITLECMPEDFVKEVFGGAEKATVNGNVELTVTSGKFGRVFGGNNEGGDIRGSIKVNVYEEGCKPLIIGELYGGGNAAPYSIFGCTEGTPWTANESGTPYYGGDPDDRVNIEVNVFSCTSIGKVFGGGMGSSAKVIGNTHVWINPTYGSVDTDGNGEGEQQPLGKIGQVFGGGGQADVIGNTLVDIGTATYENADNGVIIVSGDDYLNPESNTTTSITAGVYGGGSEADVDGNATLNIGTKDLPLKTRITGNIFGGGYGQSTHVTGNVIVNIGTNAGTNESPNYVGYAIITGDVYGGSAKGTVNLKTDNSAVNTYTYPNPEDPEQTLSANCYTKMNFYGGAITGNLYGGGLGEDNVGSANDYAADVYGPVTVTMEKGSSTNTVVNKVFGCNNVLGTPKEAVTVNINGGTVNYSVYGGGNQAAYAPSESNTNYPAVNINNGTVTENVFGGGLGTTATVTGNPQVTIGDTDNNHTAAVGGSVYGGGDAGDVDGNPRVNVDNVNTTIAQNVFGAGKGVGDTFTCEKAMVGVNDEGACENPGSVENKDKGTMVIISNGTIGTLDDGILDEGTGNVYGGGEIGRVEWNTQVKIGVGTGDGPFAPIIYGNVFGAGKGLETHGYSALVRGNSSVTIQGNAKVGKNVYGGGEIATAGRYWVNNVDAQLCEGESRPTADPAIPTGMPYQQRSGGICSVTVQGNAEIGYNGATDDAGHVFGAGKGVTPHYVASGETGASQKMTTTGLVDFESRDAYLEFLETLSLVTNTSVTIDGSAQVKGNVYGGSESGFVQTATTVNIQGTCVIGTTGTTTYGSVFGGGRGLSSFAEAGKIKGRTTVSVSGGTVNANVYGGGELGYVQQNVAVTISGGTVVNDVYGGGALANTNTDNWDFATPTSIYLEMSNLTPPYYTEKKDVNEGADVTGLYTRSGSEGSYVYTATEPETTADGKTIYYERHPGSSVNGLYTKSGNEYSAAAGEAVSGITYYEKRDLPGTWAADKSSTSNTTTVTLIGGVVGNAYGGGLGDPTHPVYVCGDVLVSVNDPSKIGTNTGVGFTSLTKNDVTIEDDDNNYVVTLTGRVFGCNNIKGTPLGDVNVKVFSTRTLNAGGNVIPHVDKNSHTPYEIQAVYGGGNQADYVPASGKGTHVLIDGCNETTIKKVYGGGSSASVPATDVLIKASLDIGFAFGGGNGGEKVYDYVNKKWKNNEGASVNGLAKIDCQGGKIGQVFGGSDNKGDCRSTSVTQAQVGSCPLVITRMYGAGNEADVTGDVNIVVSGCTEGNSQIEYICGGSYNAHITGSVTLTITSGFFNSVYGGNEATGSIGGDITVNIEETDVCKPIIIGNLVGGGNMAPYPGTLRNGEAITDPGNITVNVKSATRIDNIYGGGFESEVLGNTTVNINMMKGYWAGKKYEGQAIPNCVGVIGNVYGGGNAGRVRGNSTVNIGTETTIQVMKRDPGTNELVDASGNPIYDGEGKFNDGMSISSIVMVDKTVEGAHITGDVFGGGRMADVTGNTEVNICAKKDGTWGRIAFNNDSITIGGNVFGGGKGAADSFTCEKAMVGKDGDNTGVAYSDKGTNVRIGSGTIGGSVYGGGEIGRVEFDTKVTIGFGDGASANAKSPIINGYVYGAGQGVSTHGYSGLVRGNSTVTIEGDSWVKQSVYGAGKLASLGRYNIAKTDEEATAHGVEKGMPYELLSGGQSTVTIQGHTKIGPAAAMTMPTFSGNVFGAGKGVLPYDVSGEPGRYYIDNSGNYTWESYADESKEEAYIKYVETLGITNNTIVTIGGDAFVKGSVYGGSENGSVFAGTIVNIAGGQIGCGKGKTAPHASGVWAADYTPSEDLECASWPYESPHAPYDKYAGADGKYENGKSAEGGLPATGSAGHRASDGHTFYGNVFGGGSGKDPYKPGKWHRKAGYVGGNTVVNITGGHILTSIYGGNEMTDVGSGEDLKVVAGKGKCSINMTGGTLGVPRTDEQIKNHPVTCYLFGAGKGDQRIFFNKWTNVSETEVNITGDARIFGSVFGGGEDGHVLGNTEVNIGDVTIDTTPHTGNDVKIGTSGTSYLDGNVFGGGRGFSGEALTAGAVVGNVTMTISNGTMLGSVYGGGRLASVGTGLENVTLENGDPNPGYGLIYDDTDEDKDGAIEPSERHGHITLAISGGTIGNGTTASDDVHSVGGNVYGGSMGRITLLDDTRNPLWPKLAVAKLTEVTISGGTIWNSVYGGSEYGIVRNRATVNITNGTIHGNVFGGGYGSDEQDKQTIAVAGYSNFYYTFTPLTWTGCVSGSTFVNVSGGTIKKNVYGGGDMASVGLIDFVSDDKGNYTNMTKHDNSSSSFALSWPYKFTYHAAAPKDDSAVGGGEEGGKTTVKITGTAVVGTYDGSGNVLSGGYVFGAGKGKVWFGATKETEEDITQQRYKEAFMSNVKETEVTIGTDDVVDNPKIRTVYGGGEDGHVYEDASVTIYHGTIVNSVFGGGKGEGTFKTTLWKATGDANSTTYDVLTNQDAHSWTAGKVYGNTSVTMKDGSVGWFVYGGGNLASVGKGSYSGGADDYSTAGYGETLNEAANVTDRTLWNGGNANSLAFLNSGKTTVTILGGTVGAPGTGTPADTDASGVPHGSVFGGSRGSAAASCRRSPRYRYVPDFFLGYTNKSIINIGGTKDDNGVITYGSGPTIHGSVYGGGQDGHVRDSTGVHIYKGNIAGLGETDTSGRSGNVFGAGSGIGTFDTGEKDGEDPIMAVNNSSGSVTCTTFVEVNDDGDPEHTTIHGSVYGGGALEKRHLMIMPLIPTLELISMVAISVAVYMLPAVAPAMHT